MAWGIISLFAALMLYSIGVQVPLDATRLLLMGVAPIAAVVTLVIMIQAIRQMLKQSTKVKAERQ